MKHFPSTIMTFGAAIIMSAQCYADVTRPMIVLSPDPEVSVSVDNTPEVLGAIEPQAGDETENVLIPLNDIPAPQPIVNQVVATPPATQGLEKPVAVPVTAQQNASRNAQANPETVQPVLNNNAFFDAGGFDEPTELSRRNAARVVDPTRESVSSYITVMKTAEPNSQASQAVSAQRAYDLGRYQSALSIYSRLIEQYPSNENALFGRALSLQKLGRDAAAIQAYKDILNINPDHTDAQINMIGIMGQRYPAVAVQRLKTLYGKNKNNTALLSQIAVLEANAGLYESALEHLSVANGLEPRNPNHIYNMAVIADMAGDVTVALDYYEQALQTDAIYGGSRSIPRNEIFARMGQLR